MKIVYNNTDISSAFKVLRCEHDMYSEGRADTLVLKLDDPKNIWKQWGTNEGDVISLEDGSCKTGKMYVNQIIPENGYITFKASSIRAITMTPRQKSWEKIYFKQIVEEISNRNNLKVQYYGVENHLYSYVTQDNVDDFTFLNQRCLLEGYSFIVFNQMLNVFSNEYMQSQPALIKISALSTDELRQIYGMKYGACRVTNGSVRGMFIEDAELPEKSYILNCTIQSTSEANRYARNLLAKANNDYRNGIMRLYNQCIYNVSAGSVVYVADQSGTYNHKGFITHLRNDYKNHSSKMWYREVE